MQVTKWLKDTDMINFYEDGIQNQSDMLTSCTFATTYVHCDKIMGIVQTVDNQYCHTISDRILQETGSSWHVGRSGIIYGLSMVVNINQPEYSNQASSNGAGIKV